MRRFGSGVTVWAWLAGPVAERPCHAQPVAEPIQVQYDAPAGCPTDADFFGEVLARTPRARRASGGDAARTFTVMLTQGAEATFGRLLIRAPDGGASERDVTGETCAEVVSALALITALAVDPQASTRPLPPKPPGPAAPPAPTPPSTPPPPPAPVRPPGSAGVWHFAFRVDASVVAGLSPGSLLAAPLTLDAVAPAGGPLAPTFHLGFERTTSGSIDAGSGAPPPSARFTWTLAVLEGCPHRWSFGAVSVEPCVRVEVGSLEGSGADISPTRSDTRSWIALGGVGRAEWAFVRPMFLDLEAGFVCPLSRTTYFFEPDRVIYRPSVAGAIVSGGLGVRFL